MFDEARRKLDPATATEEDKKGMIELGHQLKEKQLALEREYSDKMMKVISAQQIMALKSGQFDDLDGAAERILFDDDDDAPPPGRDGGDSR